MRMVETSFYGSVAVFMLSAMNVRWINLENKVLFSLWFIVQLEVGGMMIRSKAEYMYYLQADKEALKIGNKHPPSISKLNALAN